MIIDIDLTLLWTNTKLTEEHMRYRACRFQTVILQKFPRGVILHFAITDVYNHKVFMRS